MATQPRNKLEGYDFYRTALKSARYVVAPMVDMSELAWRILSRGYGAELCYTPMFHSGHFAQSETYRRENFQTCPEDRPLIVQFCGNDPQTVLKAARYVQDKCDAVDINLGCPQGIAKRGHYGAFLQDDWHIISGIVSLLHKELSVPVTCKIRIFDDVSRTIEYAKMLERSGCQLLTVHGRTREMKGPNTGIADWDQIRAVRQVIRIPMFANGNILYFEDIERCLEHTGVDGIMTAETNLNNPALFTNRDTFVWEVVDKYLEIAVRLGTSFINVKGHVFKLYNITFQMKPHLRELLSNVHTVKEICDAQTKIKAELEEDARGQTTELQVQRVTTCPNFRQLPYWICQPYFRSTRLEATDDNDKKKEDEITKKLQQERKKRREAKRLRKQALGMISASGAKAEKEKKYPNCPTCKCNPASFKCIHKSCKPCCFKVCVEKILDCAQHNVMAKQRILLKEQKIKEVGVENS